MLTFAIETENNKNAKTIFPNFYQSIMDFVIDSSNKNYSSNFERKCANLNTYVASMFLQSVIDTAYNHFNDLKQFLKIKNSLIPEVGTEINYVTFADGYYTGRFEEKRLRFYMHTFANKLFVNFVSLINNDALYDDKEIYQILNQINSTQKSALIKSDYFLAVPLYLSASYMQSLVNFPEITEEDLSNITFEQYVEIMFANELLMQIKKVSSVNAIANYLGLNT